MHIEFCVETVCCMYLEIHPLPKKQEEGFRKELVEEALEMLTEAPKDGQHALIHE